MALPDKTQARLSLPLRRLRSMCLLMVLGVLATSCYSLETKVVVNDDGSGSLAIEYIIDKDTSEASLLAGDLISPCDAVTVMQNAAPNGSLFTPLDSASQCGARITMDFANETELATGMQTLSDRSRFAGFGYFPEILITRGDTEGSWNFQSQFKPPLPSNLEAQTDFRSEVADGSFVISIDLPGRQVEHNADRIDENGVMIFEVNPLVDPSGQIFVQTEPGAKILGVSEGGGFLSSTMVFALVLLAAAGGAYFIVQRSKKRRQYEGYDDDDDGVMISASERLGLGASDPTPAVDAAPSTPSEPDSSNLFSDDTAPQTASWPMEEPGVVPSPVFDSVEEPPEPQSWVAGTQAIEAEPAPEAANVMADWPSAQPEAPFDPSGAIAEMQPAPIVASGVAQSVIVDHSNDSISSVPAAGNFPAMEPASVVPETNGWPTLGGPALSAPGVAPFAPSDAAPLEPAAPFGVESSLAAPAPAWPTAAPVEPAPPTPEPAPVQAAVHVAPEPSAPEPATTAPTQADMVWDEQRKAYVVFDHRRSSWMTFDDATQSWVAIS